MNLCKTQMIKITITEDFCYNIINIPDEEYCSNTESSECSIDRDELSDNSDTTVDSYNSADNT